MQEHLIRQHETMCEQGQKLETAPNTKLYKMGSHWHARRNCATAADVEAVEKMCSIDQLEATCCPKCYPAVKHLEEAWARYVTGASRKSGIVGRDNCLVALDGNKLFDVQLQELDGWPAELGSCVFVPYALWDVLVQAGGNTLLGWCSNNINLEEVVEAANALAGRQDADVAVAAAITAGEQGREINYLAYSTLIDDMYNKDSPHTTEEKPFDLETICTIL